MSDQAEINRILANEISDLRSQVGALGYLAAVLFSELALLAPDPEARLEEMLSTQEGILFAAIEGHDLNHPGIRDALAAKETIRDQVFDFSRKALRLQLAM